MYNDTLEFFIFKGQKLFLFVRSYLQFSNSSKNSKSTLTTFHEERITPEFHETNDAFCLQLLLELYSKSQ